MQLKAQRETAEREREKKGKRNKDAKEGRDTTYPAIRTCSGWVSVGFRVPTV